MDTPPSTPGSTVTVDRPATPPTTPGSTDSSTDSAPTPGTPGGRHLSLDYIAHVIDRRCCCHCSRWYVLRKMFLEGIDAWQIEFHPNMYEVDMTFARRGPGRTSKAGSPVAMHIRCRSCKRVSKPIVHDERYGWGDLANTLYIYYREHQLSRDPRCDSGACVCGLNYCGYTNERNVCRNGKTIVRGVHILAFSVRQRTASVVLCTVDCQMRLFILLNMNGKDVLC